MKHILAIIIVLLCWVAPAQGASVVMPTYNPTNNYIDSEVYRHILRMRLHKKLRVILGKTYGVAVVSVRDYYQISFTCSDDVREMMTNAALAVAHRLAIEGPSVEEDKSARIILEQRLRNYIRTNDYWIEMLIIYSKSRRPLDK